MKKLFKWVAISLMIILVSLFLLATGIYFYVDKNSEKIIALVENRINESDRGVWCVDSVGVNIINSYPKIEVSAYYVSLYADSLALKVDKPIANISKISFVASAFELLKKDITVSSLRLEDVELNIAKKGKNRYNITPLFLPKSQKQKIEEIYSDSSSISRLKLHAKALTDKVASRIKDEMQSKLSETLKELKLDVKTLSVDNISVNYIENGDVENLKINSVTTNLILSDSLFYLKNANCELYTIPVDFSAEYKRKTEQIKIDFSTASSEKIDGVIKFDGKSVISLIADFDSKFDILKLSKGVVNGNVLAKGAVEVVYDLESRKVENNGTNLVLNLENIETSQPKILDGEILVENSEIEGKNLDIEMGINRLNVDFSLSNILDFVNTPKTCDLPLIVSVTADSLNSYMIRERLGLVVDTVNSSSDIRNLSLKLSTSFNSSQIEIFRNLEAGSGDLKQLKLPILIENYALEFADGRQLNNLTGKAEIEGLSVKLTDINGYLDGNPLSFNGEVDFFEAKEGELFEKIEISAAIESDKMLLKDLIFNEFVYPKSDGDVLTDKDNMEFEKFTANVDFELFPPLHIPSKSFDNYNFDISNASMMLRGEPIEGVVSLNRYGDRITIKDGKATYLDINADINGVVWAKNREKSDTINISIEQLDFDKINKDRKEPIKFVKFHKDVLANLSVDKLQLSNNEFTDFSAQMVLGNPDMIVINRFMSNFVDGKVDFSAKVTKSGADNLFIDFDGDFDNLTIEKMDMALIEKLKIYKNSVEGVLSGSGNGKILVKNFAEIDLNSTFVKLDFMLCSMRLVNFKFPDTIKRYLKRFDIADILVDTMQNSITISSGKISLPRMNIASSIGNYFVEGQIYTRSDSVNMILEIPYNVASKAALGVIFGGGSDSNRNSEQQIYDEVRKRYIKLYITAIGDDVKVSIRDKSSKKEQRRNRAKELGEKLTRKR